MKVILFYSCCIDVDADDEGTAIEMAQFDWESARCIGSACIPDDHDGPENETADDYARYLIAEMEEAISLLE